MPRYTVDLHNHTPLITSDWRGSPGTTPREIVETALDRGIDVWGATDHFSVEYAPGVIAAAEEVRAETGRYLLVLPGAELKVRHDGEETHLVCLFPQRRADLRFRALLSGLGMTLPPAPIEDLPYVSLERDPVQVARLVDGLGGLCHLGHVDRTFGGYCFIDSELVHQLVESHYFSAVELIDHSCRERFRDGLAIAHISSSDAHSLDEIGRRTAALEMPELSFEGLRAGLRAMREVAAA